MKRLPPGLTVALSGGILAALLTFVVELLFRKNLDEASWFAFQPGACAFLGAALVAPAFLRLRSNEVSRALLLASAALAMTYVFFGLVNVVKDALAGSETPFSAFVALPVFAFFSLPLALPIALATAWCLHRRNTQLGHPCRARLTIRSSGRPRLARPPLSS